MAKIGPAGLSTFYGKKFQSSIKKNFLDERMCYIFNGMIYFVICILVS